MTDKSKESLSALIDGEASEIEVHRLLRQFGDDESLKNSWMAYQQIRSVVRRENTLSSEQHQALHTRICDAVSAEMPFELGEVRRSVSLVKPAAGLAVAASLAAAVIFGAQVWTTPGAPAGAPTADNTPARQVITARPVSNQVAAVPESEAAEPTDRNLDLRELDAEKQRLLRAYLNQHDRMVRMNPNAQFVTFDNPASK